MILPTKNIIINCIINNNDCPGLTFEEVAAKWRPTLTTRPIHPPFTHKFIY